MSDIYLMCGVPGSGKSTFLKNNVNLDSSIVISRDEIRFSLLKPDEEYFSHEKEVVNILWKQINEAIATSKNVFIDQTSLTPKSRKWILTHIQGYNHANAIWIDENLDICLKRNEMRRGTRAYVPPHDIRQMYTRFIPPSLTEGFYRIYRYKDNKLTYSGVI